MFCILKTKNETHKKAVLAACTSWEKKFYGNDNRYLCHEVFRNAKTNVLNSTERSLVKALKKGIYADCSIAALYMIRAAAYQYLTTQKQTFEVRENVIALYRFTVDRLHELEEFTDQDVEAEKDGLREFLEEG